MADTSWLSRDAHDSSLSGESSVLTQVMNTLFSVGGSVWGLQVGNLAGRSLLLRTDSAFSSLSAFPVHTLLHASV